MIARILAHSFHQLEQTSLTVRHFDQLMEFFFLFSLP
jgi:hypothetical protein